MVYIEKTSYVLGSELWEQNFKSLLRLVKEFIVNMWEVRKQKLYGDDSCPNQLQSQSSPGGLRGATGFEGQRDGKFLLVSLILLGWELYVSYITVLCVQGIPILSPSLFMPSLYSTL